MNQADSMEIELPGILHVIHSKTLPKDEAEESLLYVRYLLLREDDLEKQKLYNKYIGALKERIDELNALEPTANHYNPEF